MLARVLGKLSHDRRQQIHKILIALTRVGQSRGFLVVPVATGCSETDRCVINLNMLSKVFPGAIFNQQFQVEIDKEHMQMKRRCLCADAAVIFSGLTNSGG